jgi:hypothetical protein
MRLSLITTIAVSLVHQASCWGDLGHRTVAYLGYKYLTPETAEYVDKILANDNGWDISDAATWADQIKTKRPNTKPWHYIGRIP